MAALRRWIFSCGLLACAAFIALLGVVPSDASTLRHMDTRELVRNSDAIVIAEVTNVRSEWSPGRKRIITRTTVRVRDRITGLSASSFEILQLGGELDGVRVTVHGCPTFREGEEALLFLSGSAADRMQVTGLAQGKFEIRRDAATGAAFVGRGAPGFATLDAKRLSRSSGTGAPSLLLDSLLIEVRKHVEEGRQ